MPLCSLDDVRGFLQKTGEDTRQDEVLASLITRASRVIEVWTAREFEPVNAQARVFTYTGTRIDLTPYDLRVATQVQVDTDTTAATVVTGYRLEPKPARDSVYQAITLPDGWDTTRQREVTVTGDWGFPAIPDDVRHACVVTVGIWARRDLQAWFERPAAVPSPVREMLNPYRRTATL